MLSTAFKAWYKEADALVRKEQNMGKTPKPRKRPLKVEGSIICPPVSQPQLGRELGIQRGTELNLQLTTGIMNFQSKIERIFISD